MKKLLIMFLMILAIGCSKKYVKAPEEPLKQEGQAQSETKKVEIVEEQVTPREVEDVESSGIAGRLFRSDALFDYDKYDIRPDAREALDAVASWFITNKGVNILIEGHCDERGTNEYNLALGERRAKAARGYLAAQGIAQERMSTITYGEEKPVCTEQNESCYQKNRRAHIVDVK